MATCEERINEHMEGRLEDLRTLWDLYYEDTEAYDDDLGNIYEYGLSFDYVAPDTFKDQERGYFRYQLSWGGPSDEFRFYAEPVRYGWKPYLIEYWFLDWFDGAHRILRGIDKELLEEIFEWFNETGTTQHLFEQAMEDY
jgi:hypothetical protein